MIGLVWLLACPVAKQFETGPADSVTDSGVEPVGDIFEGIAPCRNPIEVHVIDVHDGDTATVEHGGFEELVRFIGIDTTEMNWGGTPDCWAEEATARTTQLIQGRRVWLGFDATCEDAYDRTLAYISYEGEFINRQLVREGQATAFPFEPNTSFEGSIATAEQQAQSENLGLWGACP